MQLAKFTVRIANKTKGVKNLQVSKEGKVGAKESVAAEDLSD